MGEKEGPPVVTASNSSSLAVPAASPATSDISGILDKDAVSISCSPAPSNCSFLSEQELVEGSSTSRQSPFLSINQPSPSSLNSLNLPRPDLLNVAIPDSETSSRSSMDGIGPFSRHEYRSRKRKNSSDSSSSEESVRTVGDNTDVESVSRKSSKARLNEDGNLIVPGRGADAPRGRIANIRRESNCSIDSDAASERHLRASQYVSATFDDLMAISNAVPPSPRRTLPNPAVEGPISIMTNSFLPSSCSPSPTRISDKIKQCYSPSTQQIVRSNVPYSPSPSPTQSPTRHRLLSLSPITTKASLKRRYTTGNGDDLEAKRQFARTSTSPLVTDRSFPYPTPSTSSAGAGEFVHPPPPSGILSRRPAHITEAERTPEPQRRTSLDSFSDDQKSVRDDLSEPSSVMQSDEMEMDESNTSRRIEEDQKMMEEAMQVPLPPDDDDI